MNADKRRLDLFELFIFLKTTEGTEDYGKYNARPRVSEWWWGEEGRRRVLWCEIIKAFISLREGYGPSDELKAEI